MEAINTESTRKTKITIILNSMLIFIEFSMIISILIFCFFVAKGFSVLGHIPFYGDIEVISYNGLDRKVAIAMFFPILYGTFSWIFITICGIILNVNRKRKAIVLGSILCLLNILMMFSSQFAWIID